MIKSINTICNNNQKYLGLSDQLHYKTDCERH